jgi:hypothetical protein
MCIHDIRAYISSPVRTYSGERVRNGYTWNIDNEHGNQEPSVKGMDFSGGLESKPH